VIKEINKYLVDMIFINSFRSGLRICDGTSTEKMQCSVLDHYSKVIMPSTEHTGGHLGSPIVGMLREVQEGHINLRAVGSRLTF
jgi:hypothetical protein